MKVRLTQPGFQKYTGQMGVVFFQDGLSTDHVAERDAIRMAAVMNCEWEDGSNLSPSQNVINTLKNAAPVQKALTTGEDGASTEPKTDEPPAPPAETPKWTREELEALADAQGIQGLRQIADPAGIKGRSITEMIEAIVNAGLPKSE